MPPKEGKAPPHGLGAAADGGAGLFGGNAATAASASARAKDAKESEYVRFTEREYILVGTRMNESDPVLSGPDLRLVACVLTGAPDLRLCRSLEADPSMPDRRH